MIAEFGVAPSEYWKLTPVEVGLILDAKRPKRIGGIHEDDLSDIMQRRHELEESGVKVL